MTSGKESNGLVDKGSLVVVATPIGNLGDMSERAIGALSQVDRILAEDTRHSRRLLDHFGIDTPMVALHEHNEERQLPEVLAWLRGGERLALISDAGTPLVSDPGFRVVRGAREAGLAVTTVPGPCALVAALSVAGLPSDRFLFEGFLPSRQGARRQRLEALAPVTCTLIVYESPRRVQAALSDLVDVLGPQRPVAAIRELTKTFETVYFGAAADVVEQLMADPKSDKGEYVLVIGGAPARQVGDDLPPEAEVMLKRLLDELPVKRAARVVADLTGARRNLLYQRALEWQS